MAEVKLRVRELREQNGMTQAELAKRLKVTNPAVSKWERKLAYPKIETLVAMAEIFDVSVNEILGLEAPKETA